MVAKQNNNEHIKSLAIEVGIIDGYEYWIVPAPMEGGLNGYVVFPKRPVREEGYNEILTYVPVHGGITYAEEDNGRMVYGFDTVHSNSDKFPRTDKQWIREQCSIMLKGILKAKEVEAKYLRCISNKGKAKYAQMVRDISPEAELNFGEMLILLAGRL